MQHTWYEHGDGHHCNDGGECNLCVLSVCKVCGGMEGSLTTDCSGERVPFETDQKVYNGKLDYREGEGWVNKFGPCQQSHFYGDVFDFFFRKQFSDYKTEAELRIHFGATKEEYAQTKAEVFKHVYADDTK